MITLMDLMRYMQTRSVVLGMDSGLLREDAEEIFGSQAVALVMKNHTAPEYFNVYGCTGQLAEYLTMKGARMAATYRNFELMEESRRKREEKWKEGDVVRNFRKVNHNGSRQS